jgi:hypothetical protein
MPGKATIMARFQNEIEILAPAEVVFDELSDQRNEIRWSPKMKSVELLTGEPVAVGSRLRARWAGTPDNDVVYTEYVRPTRWAMRFTSWLMVAQTAGDLGPTANGTRLVSTWDMRLRGPLRPLSALVARGIRNQVLDSIRSAKDHVEHHVA